MGFSPQVMEHYNHPRYAGSYPRADPAVGAGAAERAISGDVLKIQIRVAPGTDRIEGARFKAFGCVSVIAAGSLAAERLTGCSLEEAAQIGSGELVRELDLPADKTHAAQLAAEAIRTALADYAAKQSGGAQEARARELNFESTPSR
jgi:nitrogen fixation protein NifU and related proteins